MFGGTAIGDRTINDQFSRWQVVLGLEIGRTLDALKESQNSFGRC